MKFNIFYSSKGRLIKLYEVNRSESGIYLHPLGNRPHFTYHEDGKSWFKHPSFFSKFPELSTKKEREPLSEFVGPETITSFNVLDFNPKSIRTYQPSHEDVVVTLDPPFCIELIITKKMITLTPSPDRQNSSVFVKKNTSPIIVIEVFNLTNNSLVESRFRKIHTDLK